MGLLQTVFMVRLQKLNLQPYIMLKLKQNRLQNQVQSHLLHHLLKLLLHSPLINQLLVLTRLKHLMVLIFVINQEIHPIQILSLQSLMENLLQIMDTTLPSMESNGILLHTKIHLDLFPVGILLNDSTAHNE